MSKVEGAGVRLTPPPPKASCNYFFFEVSRVKRYPKAEFTLVHSKPEKNGVITKKMFHYKMEVLGCYINSVHLGKNKSLIYLVRFILSNQAASIFRLHVERPQYVLV